MFRFLLSFHDSMIIKIYAFTMLSYSFCGLYGSPMKIAATI